jgi:hypothetical protein
MGRTWRQAAAVMAVGLVVAGLAGCSSEKKKTTTQTSAAPTEPPNTQSSTGSFTVTAKEYSFDIPSHLTGGVVTMSLNNVGQKAHEGIFVRVGETPTQQALVDLDKLSDGGPTPAYMGIDGGVGNLQPGSNATASSTFKLTPGKYLFVCTLTDDDTESTAGGSEGGAGASTTVAGGSTTAAGASTTSRSAGTSTTASAPPTTTPPAPRHSTLGMATPVTVAGDTGQTLPTGAGSITAKDYAFDTTGLKAGQNTVLFQNTGPKEIHHALVQEFPAGVNEAAALKALQAFAAAQQSNKPPPASTPEPKEVGGSAPFDPGLGGTFNVNLQAGRTYLLLCFVSDREGGRPHAFAHGMVKAVAVK